MKNDPPNYHPAATHVWVDKTAEDAVQEVFKDITSHERFDPEHQSFSKKDLDLLLDDHNRSFFYRAAKGFIVEFLRQTAQGISTLDHLRTNAEKEMPLEAWQNLPHVIAKQGIIDKESPAGLFHATACADWLAKHGMNREIAVQTVGIIIKHSITTFSRHYKEIDESVIPLASIHKNLKKIELSLEKAANRESDHSI